MFGKESQIKAHISCLSKRILNYDYEYFVLSKPSLSDMEYDRLFNELRKLEHDYPEFICSYSPSQRIGSDLSNDFPEVAHNIPVLSLDKAYNREEIHAWIARCCNGLDTPCSLVIEEKMDGSSLVLYYEDGILSRALTRGNGSVGNDITSNIKTIRSIPLILTSPSTVAIRGEIYIQLSDFFEIKEKHSIDYANARNFASGCLRRIKSSEVAQIPLRFFAYESYGESFGDSHSKNMTRLKELGFQVNKHQINIAIDPRSENIDHLELVVDEIEQFIAQSLAARKSLDYEIDGMVIKIDETSIRETLGYTEHHPRWAIAYKFESPQGVTRVTSIDIQIGRTGRITPVARVEPVSIGGATIRNITLHNQEYIDCLGLAPNNIVSISRRGDVIPAVEEVLENGNISQWRIPTICPSCSGKIIKQGAHHFCTNFNCPSRQRSRVVFFVGRNQMDIENLGAETINILINEKIIQDIPDIFQLDYERIQALPNFGQKKVENIRKGIEKATSQTYRRLIISLGITDFGPKLAKLLEDAGYRSIEDLFSLLDREEESTLSQIKGIGEKTIVIIARQMRDQRFRNMIKELQGLGLVFSASEPPDEGVNPFPQKFLDQIWCVSGSFEYFKPRSLAIDEIRKHGGRNTSDVSSKTTHLLAGKAAGSKIEKAQKHGCLIISEAEFIKLLKEP